MRTEALEHDLPTALPSEDKGTNDAARSVCPSCGRPHSRPNVPFKAAPFALLMAAARLVIAIGAAILLVAIVVSLLQGRGMFPGEIWALCASFVLSIGVLLLYEIRDLLLQRGAAERFQAVAPGAPVPQIARGVLRTIGAVGSWAWLPLQPAEDRTLIDHLSLPEQRDLQTRIGTLTLCMAGTTFLPVLVAFVFLSPVALCIAATAVASNLFVLDWFKKRHRKWLYSTEFATRQGGTPASA